MKVSVVVTVKNEADTIGRLIDSLLAQTKKPDEIIIVDAGSTDGTAKILNRYPITHRVCDSDTNRSAARNIGIKAAKNEIIAVTDAGCTADRHWLKKLTRPFIDLKVIASAGYYRPVIKTRLERQIAPLVAVMPAKFNPKTYLPSSRSLVFKKGAAWYPEHLDYCEDLILAEELKQAGKMAVVKSAVVNWRLPATRRQFFWQIFHYAQGDVKARYRPHLIKIATMWLRYAVFLIFPWLFIIYIFKFGATKIIADSAILAGSLSAIISSR